MDPQTRAVQLIQLEMLQDTLKVLDDNNLKYIAVGGTVLGAYRHKGFIPWDDDIDIAMPREDYQKLLKLQSQFSDALYLQSFENEPAFPLTWLKVHKNNTLFVEKRMQDYPIHQGIFIDIFPLDINVDDNETAKKVFQLDRIFRRLAKPYKGILGSLKKQLYKLRYGKRSQCYKNYLAEVTKNTNQPVKQYSNTLVNDSFSAKDIESPSTLEFEGVTIKVPQDITGYLSRKYGDYMRIPKASEQITHEPVAIVLDTSCK